MTLEEAIKHAEEKAKYGGKCGEDHAQLATWLKELKELKERRVVELEKRTAERTETHACDSVSRRAALDCVSNSLVAWEAYEAIEALPAAQPEPQWIPCEESLPEMGKRVLICGKKGGIAIARRAKYLEEFDGWTFWMRGGKPMEAIAWMSLPEPYGGEQDEAD